MSTSEYQFELFFFYFKNIIYLGKEKKKMFLFLSRKKIEIK
jgi:hypothetical protein